MLRSVRQRLSGSTASAICFLIAWISKIILGGIFLDFGSDKLGQVLIAKNFLEGRGLTIAQSNIQDLSQQVYAPAIYNPPIGWPPGYSLLLSPLLWVTKNFPIACMLLDQLAALVFLIYLRKALKQLKFDDATINLFLIFQGLFISVSGPSDFIGMTFMLMGIYYLVSILNSNRSFAKPILLMTVSFIGAAMLRYLYQPVSFLLLSAFMIYGLVNRKKYVSVSIVISLVSLVVASIGWFFFQRNQHLQGVYMSPAERGFFPANLKQLNPFILSSLFNTHFYAVQLTKIFRQSYGSISEMYRWLNSLLLLILFFIFARFIKKNWPGFKGADLFWFVSGIASIFILAGLMLLATMFSAEVGPPLFNWTYILPIRYFLLPMLMVQIFVWHWLYVRKHLMKSQLVQILRVLFGIIISIEIIHGIYFISKKWNAPMMNIEKIAESSPEDVYLVKYIKEHYRNTDVLVVSSFLKRFQFLAEIKGASALYNPLELNKENLSATKPVTILLIVRKNEEPYLYPFLQKENVRLVGVEGEYSFYEYELQPQ